MIQIRDQKCNCCEGEWKSINEAELAVLIGESDILAYEISAKGTDGFTKWIADIENRIQKSGGILKTANGNLNARVV